MYKLAFPFEVVDILTKQNVGYYKTIKTARAAANRKDLEYGAIRYAAQQRKEQV